MRIANKLLDIRVSLGLTTEELANKLGLDQSTISRLENSKNDDNIRIGRIKNYCSLAGITLEEFFGCSYIEEFRPEIKDHVNTIRALTPSQIKLLTKFLKSVYNPGP